MQVVWVLPLSENRYSPDCALAGRRYILIVKTAAMKTTSLTPTLIHSPSNYLKIKRLRICSLLTQTELAELADVSQDHVDLYERGLPVPLDSRRRILKVLWAIKAKK